MVKSQKVAKTVTKKASAIRKKDIQYLLSVKQHDASIKHIKKTWVWKIICEDDKPSYSLLAKCKHGVPSQFRKLIIHQLKEGIPPSSVDRIADAFHISRQETYRTLHIPQSTFRRRQENGKLNSDESSRVYRYADLMTKTTEMMQGNHEQAVIWFKTPMEILGGVTPLEHAMTELGSREVEDLIGRIRHGVFS